MANREVEARLKMTAVDQASRVIDRLGGRIDALGRKMEAVNRRQIAANQAEKASAQAAAAAEKRRAWLMGTASIAAYAAGNLAKKAIVDFAALEREVKRIGITADASDAQIRSVSTTIMQMAQDAAMPLSDVYDGFNALVSAGRSWDEALDFLPAVVKTAQAAGAETRDIAATADALAGSMHIAGGEMQLAFDKLVKGGKLGKFELKDMASYLPSILPQMAALGYTGLDGLEKSVALLQTMRLQTGTASEAATNLTNVLGKIYSPELARAFKKQFNIDLPKSLDLAKRNGKDLLDAFIQIARKATNGDMDKLAKVFTDQQLRAGVMTLIQMSKELGVFQAGVKDAAGAVDRDLGRVLEDTQADIDRLSNSWEGFVTNLGKTGVSLGVDQDIRALGEDIDWLGRMFAALRGNGSVSDLWEEYQLKGMVANDAGAKAYVDAYMAANGGKVPTADQVKPYMGSGFGYLFGGGKSNEELAAAGQRGGTAGALAEQYRLRGEKPNYPVRFNAWTRGPALGDVIPGNVGPLPGDAFTRPDAATVMAEAGRVHGGYKAVGAYTVGSMVGGLQLPPSNENLFIGASGQFGEFTSEVVSAMTTARKEVMNQAEQMAQELISYINGIPIPPIKIRVEGQTQLARVNPGVSMPDQ